MELLVVKSGDNYIRIKEDEYVCCGLDRASVFPVEQSDRVKEYVRELHSRDFEQVSVKKLVITQEDIEL